MKWIVKILGKSSHKAGGPSDYQLFDILRALSYGGVEQVVTRRWLVAALNASFYEGYEEFRNLPYCLGNSNPEAGSLEVMFPEFMDSGLRTATVTGERLLERSALVNYFEDGLFCRCRSNELAVELHENFKLYGGPPEFQGANIDLEIRRSENFPYEVITESEKLIELIQLNFAFIELSS